MPTSLSEWEPRMRLLLRAGSRVRKASEMLARDDTRASSLTTSSPLPLCECGSQGSCGRRARSSSDAEADRAAGETFEINAKHKRGGLGVWRAAAALNRASGGLVGAERPRARREQSGQDDPHKTDKTEPCFFAHNNAQGKNDQENPNPAPRRRRRENSNAHHQQTDEQHQASEREQQPEDRHAKPVLEQVADTSECRADRRHDPADASSA